MKCVGCCLSEVQRGKETSCLKLVFMPICCREEMMDPPTWRDKTKVLGEFEEEQGGHYVMRPAAESHSRMLVLGAIQTSSQNGL